MASEDTRGGEYKHLHDHQLIREIAQALSSAETVLGILWEYVQPKTVIDIGCGLGVWIVQAQKLGAKAFGIEGPWLDYSKLQCPSECVWEHDLETEFKPGGNYDLAMCLEVAEHLPESKADTLVQTLVNCSDLILFSAAIPYQGGHHHVNEQFLDYWIEKFGKHGYDCIDTFRPIIWNDQKVQWWVRQNTVLFVLKNQIDRFAWHESHAMSIVHPDIYKDRVERGLRGLQLLQVIQDGGDFRFTKLPNGNIQINKLELRKL